MRKIFFLLFIIVIISSCGTDQMTIDDELIIDYIAENNLDAKSFDSGLYVVIENEGGIEKPGQNDVVNIDYEGNYLDNVKFDSSYDRGEPIEFPLNAFIEGWKEGIPEFGKGGSGILLIPSHLGYGSNPPNGIRSDAVLVFSIELHDFN